MDTVSSKEILLSLRLREGESFPEGHRVDRKKRPTFPKDLGPASESWKQRQSVNTHKAPK